MRKHFWCSCNQSIWRSEFRVNSNGFWLKHQSKWHFYENKTDHHDIEIADVKDSCFVSFKWKHSEIFQKTIIFFFKIRIGSYWIILISNWRQSPDIKSRYHTNFVTNTFNETVFIAFTFICQFKSFL